MTRTKLWMQWTGQPCISPNRRRVIIDQQGNWDSLSVQGRSDALDDKRKDGKDAQRTVEYFLPSFMFQNKLGLK